VVAERQPLEEPGALSESVLWSLQREYFQREGIRAWSQGVVPEMITTNAVMGSAYARMVVAFLREWRAATSDPPDEPVHIVELGAGSGRFAHHFLTKLTPRLAAVPELRGITVKHVMTDLPGGNVERWRQHPYLRAHVAAGRLDFATLDAARPDAMRLLESGTVLRPGAVSAPLVVVANYVFDSLPLDCFVVEGGNLWEYLVAVHGPRPEAGRRPELDDLELVWSRRPIGEAKRYIDPELEAVLRAVTAGAAARRVLFPTVGIHLLGQMRTITEGPLLVLSADKGYSRPSNGVHVEAPYMATHGSVSFMVDYSILAAYVRRRRGLALLPMHNAASLTVVCLVLDEGAGQWSLLSECYRDAMDVGGPDDFFSLDNLLTEGPALPALAQLLARLRAAEWDPSVFRRMFGSLIVRAAAAQPHEREVILDSARRVEELYFPIGEQADLPFVLAMVRWRAGDPAGALRLLRWSEKLHGLDADLAFGMALCHVDAGDLRAAVDATTTALRLDGGFELAAELGGWLTRAVAGGLRPDATEWMSSIAVLERSPERRSFVWLPST
jgi:hypothetical protein